MLSDFLGSRGLSRFPECPLAVTLPCLLKVWSQMLVHQRPVAVLTQAGSRPLMEYLAATPTSVHLRAIPTGAHPQAGVGVEVQLPQEAADLPPPLGSVAPPLRFLEILEAASWGLHRFHRRR